MLKNKGLVLLVALIALGAILMPVGTVMAAEGHGGGYGGHGGGYGGHGGDGWHGGGWGWGWSGFGLGLAAGSLLGYPYYYQPYYPYYSYGPYYDPYGYAPAYRPYNRVIVPEQEPSYAEEPVYSAPARTRSTTGATWYYCRKSNAYYPYVRTCAGGWERVPAVPPSSGPDDDK